MHLVNSIYNKCLETVHISCLRAEVYSEILEDLAKSMEIYPNKDEYIDFAIKYEFDKPISQLIEMTKCNKD